MPWCRYSRHRESVLTALLVANALMLHNSGLPALSILLPPHSQRTLPWVVRSSGAAALAMFGIGFKASPAAAQLPLIEACLLLSAGKRAWQSPCLQPTTGWQLQLHAAPCLPGVPTPACSLLPGLPHLLTPATHSLSLASTSTWGFTCRAIPNHADSHTTKRAGSAPLLCPLSAPQLRFCRFLPVQSLCLGLVAAVIAAPCPSPLAFDGKLVAGVGFQYLPISSFDQACGYA